MPLLGVEDDEVGVGADRDRPLPRVEAEQLRRVRREQLDHPVQPDPPLADAEVVDHVQPVLEPRPAVRNLREVVAAERLLLAPGEGAVVGRDRAQDVRAHGVPEHVLVRLVARRRRVDVLGALEVRLLEMRVVDEEVLRAGLAPHVPALLARELDRLDRLLAGDVDDVERAAGDAGQLDRAVRRLALGLGRPGERVVLRLGLALRERLLHEHVDRVAVLGVHHHERARLGRDLHRLEERLVVDHQRALVGHEELVGGDPLVGQRRELLERAAVLQVGDGDVVAHVDQLLALGLRLPVGERVAEARAGSLDAEVDVRGRAAAGRSALARLDVVDRRRAAERHVEMRVRIDARPAARTCRRRRSRCRRTCRATRRSGRSARPR